MFTLLQIAILIGSTVANMLLQPRARKLASNASPSNLSEFNLPTIEQGTPPPYIAGTALLDSPAILWYGDFNAGEIVQGGVTVGYRYDIGMQMSLCLGEIDEVLEVRFDRKALPGAPIAIGPDNESLAFHDGGLKVAHIPQGFYADPHALCVATSSALDAAGGYASPHYRVVYGHDVVAGWSDTFRYAVLDDGVWREMEVQLAEGAYGKERVGLVDVYEIAAVLEAAINAAEAGQDHPITATVTFEAHIGEPKLSLEIDRSGLQVTGFRVLGSGGEDSVNLLLGWPVNVDVAAEALSVPATLEADFATRPTRYGFGGGLEGTDFAWTRAETNCQATFGASGTRDYDGTGAYAEEDVGSLEAELTFTDLGERTRIVIDAPDHFGPDDGVTGTIDVWHGSQTQEVDDYLVSDQAIGPPLPAYLGLCYAVLRHVYIGNSGQFRPIAFVVRRCPNPLGMPDEVANIGGNANPALLLYELLTGGVPLNQSPLLAEQIETADFEVAAWQLFREQLGVSFRWDTTESLADRIETVLKHIDAVRYVDPLTGRLRLKLIRADYDVDALPRLDASSIVSCRYGRRSWGETRNVVRVTYCDQPGGFIQRVVQAQDDGNIAAQDGNLITEGVEFEGFATAARAQWAAERTLKTVSWPGAPVELVALRPAERLRPGDPFVLDWAPLGITGLVCRVANLGLGTLEDGRVSIEAIEDVWGSAFAAYAAPAASAWDNPVVPPAALGAEVLLEAPYELAGGERRRVVALGAVGEGDQHGFEIRADASGGTDYVRTNRGAELTPSGTLAGLLGYTSDEFTVRDGTGLARLAGVSAAELAAGANLALIGDEWVVWRTLAVQSDGGVTFGGLVRGVLDSTPAQHVAGTRVWFVGRAAPALAVSELAADGTVAAKLLTINRAGKRALAAAARLTVAVSSRAARPYLPTGVLFDGVAYPDQVAAPVALSWSHRNRLGVWSYDDAGATEAPESGVIYELWVWDAEGALVQHEVGAAAGATLNELGQGYRVRLIAYRLVAGAGSAGWGLNWGENWGGAALDVLESWSVFDYTIGSNHGWGLNWGENWGGNIAA